MSDIKKKLEQLAKEVIDAILKPSLNEKEEKALNNLRGKIDIDTYKTKQLALVGGSGGLAGAVGGWWGIGLVAADLVWCGKVAGQSCLGIGYILEREPKPDDIELILAIWTGMATASNGVPSGKVGIVINETSESYKKAVFNTGDALITKALTKMGVKGAAKIGSKFTGLAFESAGAIIFKKLAIKGSSKLAGKLLSIVSAKSVSKLLTKLFAKLGTSWIPVFGGIVCAGVNLWLVNGLLEASEKYYKHDYVILNDLEIFE